MGISQSKHRKSRSLSSGDVSSNHHSKMNNQNHHRSMHNNSEKASTLPRRGHNSTLTHHNTSGKSTVISSSLGSSPARNNPLVSALTVQQHQYNRNALSSSVSLPPRQQQQQQYSYDNDRDYSSSSTSSSSPHQNQRQNSNTNNYIGGLESSSRFLPDDIDSQDRGLTLHFALKRLFDGNVMPAVLSWFGNHAKVVDIGSLNGAWLMDMAVQYPKCQFIAIETSSSSTSSVIPQVLSLHNVRFENVNWDSSSSVQHIPLPDASVDIFHMRVQSLNFEQRSWLNLLSEAYRILKPGGVVQITDFHYAMTGTVLIESFIDTASDGQLGEDFMAATLSAFEEAQDLLAPKMGLDPDEYKQRVEMVCAQCVQQDAHIDWYSYVGRKPIKQHP
ncbi:hypothetical protein INT45_005931 [Circinella minor]|uniref:Methyltransferase domain-containing protein n=1 Tax=Circinella minor TaxID=1195481 RepID=A0A8H7S9P7_9FUNG|nr:hypothetical protein INT45_005931 [Circinella minor]